MEQLPQDITVDCDNVPDMVTLTATDNCGTANVVPTADTTDGSCPGSYSIERTWTATDQCGNVTAHTQIVTVQDTTDPVFVEQLPQDITVDCDNVPDMVTLTATDNCGTANVIPSADTTDGSCPGSYSIERTWTATDQCGNVTAHTQIVTVQDTTDPVLHNLPSATLTVNCDQGAPAPPVVTATDNCDTDVAVNYEELSNTVVDGCGQIVRRWTAEDDCGNPVSFTQTITVEDNTPPVLSVPLDTILFSDENCSADTTTASTGMATATDNCDTDPTVSYVDRSCFGTDVSFTLSANSAGQIAEFDISGLDNLKASDIKNLDLSFSVTQGVGNAQFWLIAPSGQAVILVGPYCGDGDVCSLTGTFNVTFNSTASTVWNNSTNASLDGLFQPNGETTSEISVPGVSLVSGFDQFTGDMNGTWRLFGRKQKEVDGGIGTLTFNSVCLTPALSGCEYNDIIVRHWTATDNCNNVSAAQQVIQVIDNTAPVFADLPADTTIACPEVPVFAQAIATDNCSAEVDLTYKDTTTNGGCAGEYSITRTWTAVDDCGNTSTASQTIHVIDTTAPVWDNEAAELDANLECADVSSLISALQLEPTATDSCGSGVTVTLVANDTIDGDCAGSFTIIKKWTATDDCDNTSAEFVQTITVTDAVAPVWDLAANSLDAELTCDNTNGLDSVLALAPTATDDCNSGVLITLTDSIVTPGNCAGSFTIVKKWKATDNCDNVSSEFIQTITVSDNVAPVWDLAAGSLNADLACDNTNGLDSVLALVPSATDECGSGVSVTLTDSIVTPGDCAGNYTIERKWTAKDDCGNTSAEFVQTISVSDDTAPIVNCPGDQNRKVSSVDTLYTTSGTEFDLISASEECGTLADTSVVVNGTTYDIETLAGFKMPLGTNNITWKVTDNCGNTGECSFTVTVTPSGTPRTICVIKPLLLDCGDDYLAEAQQWVSDMLDTMLANTEDDEPITLDMITSDFDGELPPVECVTDFGSATGKEVIFTVTDSLGNQVHCYTKIAIIDRTPPSIDTEASDLVVECDGQGNVSEFTEWLNAYGGAAASDICSEVSWSMEADTTNICGGADSVSVTFIASDTCGNSSSTTAAFVIKDRTDPTFTAPDDVTIYADANCEFNDSTSVTGDVTDEADNCSSALQATFEDELADGECDGQKIITRTWTLVDDCGNTATDVQVITVLDTIDPTFTAPDDITIYADANCEFNDSTSVTGDVTDEADNCSSALQATFEDELADGECDGRKIITRTWTLLDDCGNTATDVQVITVLDTIDPTFTAPDHITIYADANCEFNDSTSLTGDVTDEADNCSSGLQATFEDELADGECEGQKIITRTWTLVDDCGNTATDVQVITVLDTIDPTFTAPDDITIYADANCEFNDSTSVTGDVTNEADNCSSDLEATFEDELADGNCMGEKVITRTWTLVDDCGNTATDVQVITVLDTIDPTFTAPTDITIYADANCEFNDSTSVTGDVTDEADNCSSALQATFEDELADGNCMGEKVITRTWTLVDDCGNTATDVQVITVLDTIDPTFTAPNDITIYADANCEFNDSTLVTGDVTDEADNCSSALQASFEDELADGECDGQKIITRTWTLVDDCGNTATDVQTITVLDTMGPIITVPVEYLTMECFDSARVANWAMTATATDGCDKVIEVDYSYNEPETNCNEEVTVTFTATDDCGNVTTETKTFEVDDITKPDVPQAPADLWVQLLDSVPAAVDLTATDNCSGDITVSPSEDIEQGPCENSTKITRTWIFADDCGNVDSVKQVINVNDNTPPVPPIPPADTMVLCAGDVPAPAVLYAQDNNGDDILGVVSRDTTEGECVNNFSITYTWTFTDDCGNDVTVEQLITVNDTVSPTFVEALPQDTTVNCDAIPVMTALTATDNCGSAIVTPSADTSWSELCASSYVITRKWVAEDECGNTTEHTQVVTVQDTTPPTLEVEAMDMTIDCYGVEILTVPEVPLDLRLNEQQVGALANPFHQWLFTQGMAFDNCGDVSWSYEIVNINNECGLTGSAEVDFIAMDECGNSVTTSATFTVQDTTPPALTEDAVIPQGDQEIDACMAEIPEGPSADAIAELFEDNCGTVTVTKDTTEGENSDCHWSVTYTYSIVDECGNFADEIEITYAGGDNTPPAIICPNDTTLNIDANDPYAIVEIPLPTVSDACGNVTYYNDFTGEENASAIYPIGDTEVTYYAEDECGNIDSCKFTVSVLCENQTRIDGEVYVGDLSQGQRNVMVTLIPQGNTPGDVQISVTNTKGQYAFVNMVPGEYLVQVQDANLNAKGLFNVNSSLFFTTIVECEFQTHNFEYEEFDGPVIGDLVWYDVNQNGIQDEWYDANDDGEVTQNFPDFSNNGYVDFNSWEWIDMNGDGRYDGPENEGELNKAGVGNALNPNIIVTGPNNFTDSVVVGIIGYYRSRPDVMGDYTVTLDFDANLSAVAASKGRSGLVKVLTTNTKSARLPKGINDPHAEFDAECGVTSDNPQFASLSEGNAIDLTKDFGVACVPMTIEVRDMTVECDGNGNLEDFETFIAQFTVDTSLYEITIESDTTEGCGLTRTVETTGIISGSEFGNDTVSAIFRIEDTTPPDITTASNQTVNCDEDYTPILNAWLANNGGATADDLCGGVRWSNNFNGLSNSCGTSGSATVTFTATDDCGNFSRTTATFSVVDNSAPTLTAQAQNLIVECDGQGNVADLEAWLASNAGASGFDNCGEINWDNDFDGLTVENCGASVTVTFTAFDECDNSVQTSATFTIVDTEAPDFTVPADTIIYSNENCEYEAGIEITGDVSDESDICSEAVLEATFTDSIAQGECAGEWIILRTWNLADGCGNDTSKVQTITVRDNIAPTLTCNPLTVYTGEDGSIMLSDTDMANLYTVSDNCTSEEDISVTISQYEFGCNDAGIQEGIAVAITATDLCGNVSTCTTAVTVIDTIAPVAVCSDIEIALNASGYASITLENIENGSSDNCMIDTMFIDKTEFTCDDRGENQVTLTVIDAAGNESTCTATVTVKQGEALCGINPTRFKANPDTLTLIYCPGGTVTGDIDLFSNDEGFTRDDVSFNVTTDIPVGVSVTNGELVYLNETANEAVLTLTYSICDLTDSTNCDSAEVTIRVLLDTDCDGVPDIDDIDDDDDGILDVDEESYALNQETLDSDGDGIVDRLDIDSDNDGIPDNIEWQQTIAEGLEADRRGRLEIDQVDWDYYPPLGIDSNGDGWDDQYDTENEGVYYAPLDMDLDFIPDYLDDDSDGDGIPDYIEGWDEAPHDTIADTDIGATDSDGDGLYDPYDSYDTSDEWLHGLNAIGSYAPLQDIAGDTINGIRDWRDIIQRETGRGNNICGEPVIPNGFSPNNDNINDYFEMLIYCVNDVTGEETTRVLGDDFTDAKIEIYNRWGNLLYEKERYGNTDYWGEYDAWWDGTSTNSMQIGNDKLPTGTYFYILYLNNERVITGSVFLNN
ncbi:gliding motility-associated C-terminal domain-containing protein [Maribellus sediminis]|uniref:HYR-like domain-containing protein n=1 Tax=Maribellus sediminis TaxID=2696285 RepID=UPI0019820964|nr:gliding motility-associated C-terminal domain-containing protein [Maribellus sediminis]